MEGPEMKRSSTCTNCHIQETKVRKFRETLGKIKRELDVSGIKNSIVMALIENANLIYDRPTSVRGQEPETVSKTIPMASLNPTQVVQVTPDEKATSILLIVEKIMSHLPLKDRLNCRLVNNLWSKLATLETIKRQDLIIKFKFHHRQNYFQTDKGSLQQLHDLLDKNGDRTPFVHFYFFYGSMTSPPVQNFFVSHGHSIKTLSLHLHRRVEPSNIYDDWVALRNILVAVSQSLECLKLAVVPFDEQVENLTLPNLNCKFPNLKKLTVDEVAIPTKLWHELLNSAPYVKKVKGFKLNWLQDFISRNKLQSIRTLDDSSIRVDNLDTFLKLSKFDIKLHKIRFTFAHQFCDQKETWPRLVECITKILNWSRDTLTFIWHFNELKFLPGLQFPIMRKVKGLSLAFEIQFMSHENPPLEKIFPCLENLWVYDVNGINLTANHLTEWANQIGCMSSVQSLCFSSSCTSALIEKLVGAFPNTKKLTVTIFNMTDVPDSLRVIWTGFKHVEIIDLSVMRRNFHSNLCSRMDSAITGIDPKICTNLVTTFWKVSLPDAEKSRVLPSILDAKKLKSLKLNFGTRGAPKDLVISHVAEIYAFQLMRQNQGVTIQII